MCSSSPDTPRLLAFFLFHEGPVRLAVVLLLFASYGYSFPPCYDELSFLSQKRVPFFLIRERSTGLFWTTIVGLPRDPKKDVFFPHFPHPCGDQSPPSPEPLARPFLPLMRFSWRGRLFTHSSLVFPFFSRNIKVVLCGPFARNAQSSSPRALPHIPVEAGCQARP